MSHDDQSVKKYPIEIKDIFSAAFAFECRRRFFAHAGLCTFGHASG